MKKTILFLLIGVLLLSGCAGAATPAPTASGKPWPTHAPDATPYVRVLSDSAVPEPAQTETAESMEDVWDAIYERFGNFYAKKDEVELFRSLPQEEPYSFVPHSERFVLDEGEAMRMARLFGTQEGVDARVIAMQQIVDGLDDWSYLTVLTMTPARLFQLSEELKESFMIEQFWPAVEERFDIAYWPDGIYADAEAMLRERYTQLGCFYFEPEFWDEFQALPEEAADYVLMEFMPTGWSMDGQQVIWQLWGRTDCALSVRWRENSAESLAVITATPEQITALNDQLPGRYLITPLTDEQREIFQEVMIPGEGVPES